MNGDLVKFDEGQLFCSDRVLLYRSLNDGVENRLPARSMANWEEWCSGMDGFGGLVMLAASLVG